MFSLMFVAMPDPKGNHIPQGLVVSEREEISGRGSNFSNTAQLKFICKVAGHEVIGFEFA